MFKFIDCMKIVILYIESIIGYTPYIYVSIETSNLSYTYNTFILVSVYSFAGVVIFKHRFWTTETVKNTQLLNRVI